MSSPRRRRHSPPPELPDDAIRDILLRTPPDDPRRLVRASLACKPWRGVLSDPAFCHAYRELHRRTPPLLGFIHNKGTAEKPNHCVLVPTTAFRPPGGTDRRNWIALDSRHGRVLLHSSSPEPGYEFFVWDPITDEHWRFCFPQFLGRSWSAMVLCAMEGCDHVDCHGGPFLVVHAGLKNYDGIAFVSVYSSVAGQWSYIVLVEHPDATEDYPGLDYRKYMDGDLGFSVLRGKTAYFPSEMSNRILEYNIAEKRLSVIDTQFQEDQKDTVLITAEDDGVLVFAGVEEFSLHVWSRKAGQDGTVVWARRRIIHLDMLVPGLDYWTMPDWGSMSGALLVGSADGVIFLGTHAGLYTIDISSDHTKGIKHHCLEHLNPSA